MERHDRTEGAFRKWKAYKAGNSHSTQENWLVGFSNCLDDG